jgi:anti-sigma B factor antagonist
VSNTGWTPAVPRQTNDIAGGSDVDEFDPDEIVLADGDAMPDQVIEVSVERADDVAVVRVSGEIDMLTTPKLSTAITEQLNQHPAILVLDLRGVAFLGSSGLAALISARQAAAEHGATLRLVSAAHAVLRPLAATGLADLFEIYADLPPAMQR